MVIEDVFTQAVADLDPYFEFAALGVCFQLFRQADVALAVGRVLEQLTKVIPITFGRYDLRWILDGEEACLIAVNMHLPRGTKWNDNVIARAEFQIAELRFEHATSFMYPPRLIRLRVAIEIVHAFAGTRYTEDHISICKQRDSRRNGIGS